MFPPAHPWFPTLLGTEDEEGWDDYTSRMAQDGAWAGHPELHAASLCLRRNIQVYQAEQPIWQITNWKEGDAGGPTLRLSYHDGNHYNSVAGSGSQAHEAVGGDEACPAAVAAEPEPAEAGKTAVAVSAGQGLRGRAKKTGRKARTVHAARTRAGSRDPSLPCVRVEISTGPDGEGPARLALHLDPARPSAGAATGAVPDPAPPTPWVKLVSRNKKCPCGSGLKYKACCALVSARTGTGPEKGAVDGDASAAAAGVDAKFRMIHI